MCLTFDVILCGRVKLGWFLAHHHYKLRIDQIWFYWLINYQNWREINRRAGKKVKADVKGPQKCMWMEETVVALDSSNGCHIELSLRCFNGDADKQIHWRCARFCWCCCIIIVKAVDIFYRKHRSFGTSWNRDSRCKITQEHSHINQILIPKTFLHLYTSVKIFKYEYLVDIFIIKLGPKKF